MYMKEQKTKHSQDSQVRIHSLSDVKTKEPFLTK